MKASKAAVSALVVAVVLGVAAYMLSGCGNDGDWEVDRTLREPVKPAIGPVPPGTPIPSVDVSSSALIGAGMRSCWVNPEQAHGETVIWRETEGTYPGDCLVLQANLQPDICSPTMHWYGGQMLNDNIRKVQGFAYDKRCLKVELYPEWMFGGTPTVFKTCAGPGVYSNIFQYLTPNTSSIKTSYYACPNYPNCP